MLKVFIKTLFVVEKYYEPLQFLTLGEWISKLWCTCTREYYMFIKNYNYK